jgi:hypothetical protein
MRFYPLLRQRGFIILTCGVMVVSACYFWDFRAHAIRAVAAELASSHASMASRLETVANQRGQGIVVLVRSETSCYPKHSWIWVGGPQADLFAFDTRSQALTPKLPLIDSASAAQMERITTDPATLIKDIRAHACAMARR